MVALIVAALATDGAPAAVRAWFVAGLVLSLAGDVALLLPDRWFIAGLASFLLAHVAYIAGMVQLPLDWAFGLRSSCWRPWPSSGRRCFGRCEPGNRRCSVPSPPTSW